MDVNAQSAQSNKYGIDFILPNNLDESVLDKAIESLQNKTTMFKYISIEQFKERVFSGHYFLWSNDKVLAFGEPIKYPTGYTEMEVIVAKISDKEYTQEDMINNLGYAEELADVYGINQVKMNARKGWIKILKDYEVESTTMVKVL